MPIPDLSTVPAFYHNYVKQVKEQDLNTALEQHQHTLASVLDDLPEEQWNYRYAEGKWSIRELVQHLIDSERIFCYRALRFSRTDATPLPGFDENPYVVASRAHRRSKASLLEELRTVQLSTAQLFASFDDEHLTASGVANGNPVSVNAIGYIIVGHALHHLGIIRERYLPAPEGR